MKTTDAHEAAMACPYKGAARQVYFVLLSHCRDGFARPSQERIAAILGIERRTVAKALKRLQGLGEPNFGAVIELARPASGQDPAVFRLNAAHDAIHAENQREQRKAEWSRQLSAATPRNSGGWQ